MINALTLIWCQTIF